VFFNAETIIVEGNTHYSVETLLEQGGLKVGQNLFRLDKFEVIEKMEQLPYVKEVTIDRQLPSTLEINVVENQAVVWMETETGAVLLNEGFRVLEFLELPKEVLPETPPVAEDDKPEEEADDPEAEEGEDADAESEEHEQAEEPEKQEAQAGTLPVYSQLEGVPKLVGVTPNTLELGKYTSFKEGNYVGFLKRLYESFCANPDLQWNLVHQVQFNARYDINVVYDERINVVLGTLDQVETKLELVAHVLKVQGGTAQAATIDVSDTKRPFYRAENM
jgi:hypothetical protein